MHNKFSNILSHLVLGLSIIIGQTFSAQKTHLDSINISNTERQIRIDNPYLAFFQALDFSNTTFKYEYLKQNFKRVQSPTEQGSFIFNSEGVFKLNPKIVLSGNLSAERTVEKEVPNILTDERTTNTSFIHNPSYYWVPRSGQWSNQKYHINGQFAYRPLKPIIAQVGVDGDFAKSYRQNADPRPKVDNYNYKAFAKLGLNWKRHSIFGKVSYMNNYKRNLIMYVNLQANTPANDSIYIRYNEGYGNQYVGIGSNYGESEYKVDGYIWGGEYAYNTANTHLSVGYDYRNTIERFYRIYSYQDAALVSHRVYNKYSGLKTHLHSAYVNFLGNYNGKKWASRLTYEDQLDNNYNYVSQYRTYRLEQKNFRMQNSLTWFNHKNEAYNMFFNADYTKNNVKDISVILNRKLTYFQYNLGLEKEFNIKPSQKISFGVAQSLYLPLEKIFDYQPYQSNVENRFVTKIAKQDFAYDSTPKVGLNVMAKYRIDDNKIRYEVFANFNQLWLASDIFKNMTTNYNGRPTQSATVGVNVFY